MIQVSLTHGPEKPLHEQINDNALQMLQAIYCIHFITNQYLISVQTLKKRITLKSIFTAMSSSISSINFSKFLQIISSFNLLPLQTICKPYGAK
jgi:hypothetical protein